MGAGLEKKMQFLRKILRFFVKKGRKYKMPKSILGKLFKKINSFFLFLVKIIHISRRMCYNRNTTKTK